MPRTLNQVSAIGDSVSLRKTHFILGNSATNYTTSATDQFRSVDKNKKIELAKLDNSLKQDLRVSHFTLGNFSSNLQSTSQSEFNSKNLHNSISKAELNEQIRVLRSHNHKMGFDRPEYQSETHSKFSKPKHCADSVQKSNISTAELQQSHYKFGSDQSNFTTTSQTSYVPKINDTKLFSKNLTKTNFVLGSDNPSMKSSFSTSYVKHNLPVAVSSDSHTLSNDLRKHHFSLGNDISSLNSLSRQDYHRPLTDGTEVYNSLTNSQLRQSHIKLGDSASFSDTTTYTEAMKPYIDYKKLRQLENNNYKSSIFTEGKSNQLSNSFATETRSNYVPINQIVWTNEEKQKLHKIIGDIKKHNCEYGIDKSDFSTSNSQTFRYDPVKAKAGRGVLEEKLSSDLKSSHYQIGYDTGIKNVTTSQVTYQPKPITYADKVDSSSELRKSHINYQSNFTKDFGKTTYNCDYTKKDPITS